MQESIVKGKNLLLATDGKGHSSKAAQYAIELAKLTSSKLFVLYVVSPRNETKQQVTIDDGLSSLNELKGRAEEAGVEMTTLLEGGSPYESVLTTAERIQAGAVIVGTSQKNSLDRVLLGSVSEFIVRNSQCTVIVVK